MRKRGWTPEAEATGLQMCLCSRSQEGVVSSLAYPILPDLCSLAFWPGPVVQSLEGHHPNHCLIQGFTGEKLRLKGTQFMRGRAWTRTQMFRAAGQRVLTLVQERLGEPVSRETQALRCVCFCRKRVLSFLRFSRGPTISRKADLL